MLLITIPATEQWDEAKNEFVSTKEQTLKLEHSLVSLSKWESKWHKPFLSSKDKTFEETLDYIKCMTITQNVDPNVYLNLTKENFETINNYIGATMTATTFTRDPRDRTSRRVITAEVLYAWMVLYNIPFECQKWHLDRLITLIRVCGIESSPSKKMSQKEIKSQNSRLNAARRKKYNTRG